MLKKLAILGLVLLITGIALFKWNLTNKQREQREIAAWKLQYGSEADNYLKRYNQWLQLSNKERENSPFTLDDTGAKETGIQRSLGQRGRLKADMDKLATGEAEVYPFANVLYGDTWQDELNKYKRDQENREFILTGSIVCASTGAATFGFSLLVFIARLVCRQICNLRTIVLSVRRKFRRTERVQNAHCSESSGYRRKHTATKTSDYQSGCSDKLGLLFSDTKSAHRANSPAVSTEQPLINLAQQNSSCESAESAAAAFRTDAIEDSLKTQTKTLERQIAEVRQMAKCVQETTLENAKPLNNALTELTQEVSAIREYAAYQQERVEKLQDGYDWNIIRTFCLRVIRCIDNLEARIKRLSEQNVETAHLEEVRDELIFALESSGIEQFEPEINSNYRGQEKHAEAVKDKQQSKDPKLTGRIAEVIRPGYQYFINEENIKVVRTAQVRLFG